MMRSGTPIVAALVLLTTQAASLASQDQPLPFSCDMFGPDIDEGALESGSVAPT
jgi:hypothetical protein